MGSWAEDERMTRLRDNLGERAVIQVRPFTNLRSCGDVGGAYEVDGSWSRLGVRSRQDTTQANGANHEGFWGRTGEWRRWRMRRLANSRKDLTINVGVVVTVLVSTRRGGRRECC
jgi:hypothetical protein